MGFQLQPAESGNETAIIINAIRARPYPLDNNGDEGAKKFIVKMKHGARILYTYPFLFIRVYRVPLSFNAKHDGAMFKTGGGRGYDVYNNCRILSRKISQSHSQICLQREHYYLR